MQEPSIGMSDGAGLAWHAWVDDSVHVDPGLYMLAAAVADPTVCEGHRDVLRGQIRSPRVRLCWKDEEKKDRLQIAQTLGSQDLAHVSR